MKGGGGVGGGGVVKLNPLSPLGKLLSKNPALLGLNNK